MNKPRNSRPQTRSTDVVAYVRVATAGQVESGAGLDAQRAAIESECSRRGWTLTRTFEEGGASARSLNGRPSLAEALELMAAGGASALVVSKLDRLARSVADFANLARRAEAQGWAIVSCDLGIDMTTPTGGLLANVSASVAEWERKIIGVRTREALQARKAAGMRLGRPRVLDPAVAERIREERACGATFQAIADGLNADGITTPTARPWSPALVRKIALQAPDTEAVA